MKKLILTITSLLCTLPFLYQNSWAISNQGNAHKITAYLLLTRDTSIGTDAIQYLTNTLVPEVQQGKIHTDRLVLSFMDPSMDPNKITQDITKQDLQQLLIDSGVFATNSIQANDGQKIKNAISQLQTQGVQVLFAVGGWAYSCKNPEKTSGCQSNFPLTSDIMDDYANAKLATDNLNKIQPASNTTSKTYTNAWVAAAKAFGASGIDLDYEENWFVAETSLYDPIKTITPSWSSLPNGPFAIPYAVIKYAQWIKSLKESTITNQMFMTMAASAAGAYDVHDNIGGSNFWCPVHDQSGNGICGSPTVDQSNLNLGGNLKGVMYDMAHYQDINHKGYSFNYSDTLFAGLLNGIDAIDVMTYDLDDGYDGVGASWCIGMHNGQYASRDPYTPGYENIDCSMTSQTQTIIKMYHDNVMQNISSNVPHLAFGLEAGFANYPVNIDPNLPGGGNIEGGKDPSTDSHYRWNDPFIATSIPLNGPTTQEMTALTTWLNNHQGSDSLAGKPDNHAGFLIVNQNLFNTMQSAGADRLIIWSLYNADYDQHLAKTSWDMQQLNNFNAQAFGQNYRIFDYDKTILSALINNAASPEDMLNVANRFYYPGDAKLVL